MVDCKISDYNVFFLPLAVVLKIIELFSFKTNENILNILNLNVSNYLNFSYSNIQNHANT